MQRSHFGAKILAEVDHREILDALQPQGQGGELARLAVYKSTTECNISLLKFMGTLFLPVPQ